MATVESLSTEALIDIGVLQATETPSAEDAAFCLTKFNNLIDQWKAERLMIYSTTRTTWTIVSGTQDYTLALGSDINVARPVYIDHINFQDTSVSGTPELLMSPFTDDSWSNVTLKTITAPYPTAWYLNPTFPSTTISLWPVPTSSTLEGVLYAPAAIQEFASLATSVSLPPGYRRMIVANLALELCPGFEKQPSEALVRAAMDSKAVVKRSNTELMDMSVDPAVLPGTITGRRWWIYTGP